MSVSANQWQDLSFSDAVLVNPTTSLERGKVYPFVEMSSITVGTRDVKYSEQREFSGSGSKFRNRDTLMARITPCLENGKIARFQAMEGQPVGHGSTEFIVIRGRPGVSDNDFAYYLTISPEVRHFAISQMTGSSGRQRVPTDAFDAILISLPSLSEQKRIAHILGTLDDKIELNQRMNKTLEEMAQALFKSWFIDFDPVVAKSEGRQPEGMDAATAKLFPSSFEDSELGRIPKGWKVAKLGELLDIKYGKDHKKLPDGRIPVYGSGGIMRYVTKAIYSAESVLIPRKGTLNNIMYLNKPFWTVDTMFFSIEKHPCIAKYIYLRMKRMNMELLDNGSVIPSMTTEILNNLPIIIPSMQILQQFDKVISFFFAQTEQNELESRNLATMRDILLPNLLSGETPVLPQ